MALYCADGKTPKGNRTAPSAVKAYMVDIYVFVRNVNGIEKGIYKYNVISNMLDEYKKGDFTDAFKEAALRFNKKIIQNCGAIAVLVCDKKNLFSQKYNVRLPESCAYIEAGHISQNFLLAATKMNLAAVPATGFDNEKMLSALGLNKSDYIAMYFNSLSNP